MTTCDYFTGILNVKIFWDFVIKVRILLHLANWQKIKIGLSVDVLVWSFNWTCHPSGVWGDTRFLSNARRGSECQVAVVARLMLLYGMPSRWGFRWCHVQWGETIPGHAGRPPTHVLAVTWWVITIKTHVNDYNTLRLIIG